MAYLELKDEDGFWPLGEEDEEVVMVPTEVEVRLWTLELSEWVETDVRLVDIDVVARSKARDPPWAPEEKVPLAESEQSLVWHAVTV
jgi:hypothetical protein